MTRTLFVTPDFTSDVTQCRTLRTPNNAEWLGVFNKALLLMLDTWNWEQINDTDLTVEETIEAVTLMLNDFWDTADCGTACTLPGLGSPPFRLGLDGRFEMLDPVTGEWGEPTGEYEIPPVTPREEATAQERRCAAAANAAYVMGLVYEAITDEIALGGDALQVAAAMVAALVTALGGWIAAPVYAIVQLTIALFAGVIELLQALGADVWTEDYQEHLTCVLYQCSTDTGDVVTFDLDCIRENLYEGMDLLSPTFFYDAQIYAQVLFLLETITMDGLNAAGATTAITDADCDVCGGDCYEFKFNEVTGDFEAELLGGLEYASWSTSSGWQHYSATTDYRGRSCYILRDFSDFTDIESIEIFIGGANHHDVWWSFTGGVDATGYPNHETNGDSSYLITGVGTVSFFAWAMARSGVGTMTSTVERIKVTGTGNFPTPFVPCED